MRGFTRTQHNHLGSAAAASNGRALTASQWDMRVLRGLTTHVGLMRVVVAALFVLRPCALRSHPRPPQSRCSMPQTERRRCPTTVST